MVRSFLVLALSLGMATTAAAQTPAARYVFGDGAPGALAITAAAPGAPSPKT